MTTTEPPIDRAVEESVLAVEEAREWILELQPSELINPPHLRRQLADEIVNIMEGIQYSIAAHFRRLRMEATKEEELRLDQFTDTATDTGICTAEAIIEHRIPDSFTGNSIQETQRVFNTALTACMETSHRTMEAMNQGVQDALTSYQDHSERSTLILDMTRTTVGILQDIENKTRLAE